MKKGNKTGDSNLENQDNNGKQTDDGEDFEVDILRLFKIRSRRINNKVIITIILVLLFIGWILKM